jgi:hypothetical protein
VHTLRNFILQAGVIPYQRKGIRLGSKRHIDLTECFDKIDLGVESISDWSEFEALFAEHEFHRIACSTGASKK